MATANLKKKVRTWWQIPPQHQSTYLRGPNFFGSLRIFFALQNIKDWTKVVPWKKKICSWNFMKWGLKEGISIDADSGPPRYVLWCCGGICHQFLTFFQIGCGHTVCALRIMFLEPTFPLTNQTQIVNSGNTLERSFTQHYYHTKMATLIQ